MASSNLSFEEANLASEAHLVDRRTETRGIISLIKGGVPILDIDSDAKVFGSTIKCKKCGSGWDKPAFKALDTRLPSRIVTKNMNFVNAVSNYDLSPSNEFLLDDSCYIVTVSNRAISYKSFPITDAMKVEQSYPRVFITNADHKVEQVNCDVSSFEVEDGFFIPLFCKNYLLFIGA